MDSLDPIAAPAEQVARVEASARRVATPCGDGEMVWRIWGDGPPLVLLHGNFGSWMHWIRNVGPLAERYTVIVPDTPGFGESAMPPDRRTPGAIARVVAEGIEAILAPGQAFDLTGFSYGGRLASEVAAQMPDRVKTLVIVAPGGLGVADVVGPPPAKLRLRMTDAEVAQVHRENLAHLMIADPAAVDDLAVHIQDVNTRRARLRLASWSEEDRLSSTIRALARVRVPVKGIWSDRDAFAGDTRDARIAAVRAAQPNADIRIFEDAGHWMQYEAPARFNALLVEMLGLPPT